MFALKRKFGGTASVERMAATCVSGALEQLHDPALERTRAVHELRKRCNEVRALLRLLRAGFADDKTYRRENAFFRDLRRDFAGIRDATIVVEAFEALAGREEMFAHRAALTPWREELLARCRAATPKPDQLAAHLAEAEQALVGALARMRTWCLADNGFTSLAPGFAAIHRAGRRWLAGCEADPSADHLHEWRKRVKHHRQHWRALRPLWKPVVRGHFRQATVLAELLGEDHDLFVLSRTIAGCTSPGNAGQRAFLAFLQRRRGQLQAEALALGRRLYAEKPRTLTRRLGRYYEIWLAEGERTVIRLADHARKVRRA
ncbi:MAG: CHAD domain-containing protein [Alphaproteobacteria bacterium]|nr:CHAD domain-containing protein [Alphaproteobacteria bacterium]